MFNKKKAATMPLSTDRQRVHWRLSDIAYDQIDATLVRDDVFLFQTLASASYVEILSEMYSANLVEHFDGRSDVTGWLRDSWQHEEVQHGVSLKAYVQAVWPDFDWQAGFEGFQREYSACCTVEQLEPRRALELVARCAICSTTSSPTRWRTTRISAAITSNRTWTSATACSPCWPRSGAACARCAARMPISRTSTCGRRAIRARPSASASWATTTAPCAAWRAIIIPSAWR